MNKDFISLSANTSWYLYNFRASTIKALQNNGFKIICIAPDDGYGEKLASDLNCTWVPLNMDNQGSNPIKDLAVFWQLFAAYKKYKPQAVMHFTIKNNVYGTWAARLLGIPSLNNVSGLGTAFIHSGLVSQVVRGLYRSSFPLTHTVFCQNPEDFEFLGQHGLVPKHKLVLLPGSGANTEKFRPALKLLNDARPFTFLFAGRMLADKGLFELVEAMKILNQERPVCRLVLCGFADVQNATAISRQQLAEWNELPNIDYIGATDDMPTVMQTVDAAVLPSYREGMPKALLEAGAMGLASVATDVPGCRNVIQHGFNGLLCELRNAQSLAQQMKTMIEMPVEQRQLMEANARRHIVENFSEQAVVELTLASLSDAVGKELSCN